MAFLDLIGHLRDFSPAYAFLKYLIKNHRLVQCSQIIAQNDQWNKTKKLHQKFRVCYQTSNFGSFLVKFQIFRKVGNL